jgi:hypothetical protein
MNDRILIQFQSEDQANYFFNWFKEEGFGMLQGSAVGDIQLTPDFTCISSDELPGATSDPNAYYLEIE